MRTRTGTGLTEAYWRHADGHGDPGTPDHPPPTCLLPTADRAMERPDDPPAPAALPEADPRPSSVAGRA
jgi:hypothetical protein